MKKVDRDMSATMNGKNPHGAVMLDEYFNQQDSPTLVVSKKAPSISVFQGRSFNKTFDAKRGSKQQQRQNMDHSSSNWAELPEQSTL
jgi:hypothetical protein